MQPYHPSQTWPVQYIGRVFCVLVGLLLYCLPIPLCAQIDATAARTFSKNPNVNQPDSIQLFSHYFQEKDSLRLWINLHTNIGRSFIYKRGELAKSLESFEYALQTWRPPASASEWKALASVHLNLGYVHQQYSGDFIQAREHYETARMLYQDTLHRADVFLAKFVLIPLGNIHARLRDYERAEHLLREAENICRQQRDWDNAAEAVNGIGLLYLDKKGEYKAAVGYFREGLQLPQLSPDSRVRLMLNLGVSLLSDGQPEQALQWTLEGRSLLEQWPDTFTTAQNLEHWGDLYVNLGRIYRGRGQWAEASRQLHRNVALTIEKFGTPDRREVAQAYLELGALFLDWDLPDSTLHYAQIALRCLLPGFRPPDDLANPPAAQLIAEHTIYLAFQQKIRAWQRLANRAPHDPAPLLHCLANCDLLFAVDEILRREYPFEGSKLHRQDVSRTAFETALSAAYRLQALTPDPALAERAWQYAEAARERRLIESMLERDRETALQGSAATREKLVALRAKRTRLQTRIFDLQLRGETVDSLEAQLYETHLAWRQLLTGRENPLPPGEIQRPYTDLVRLSRELAPDEALLEYFTGDSLTYVFVLTKSDLHFLACPATPVLSASAQQLRQSLTDPALREMEDDLPLFSTAADQLYGALLTQPLATLPATIKQLVIVPDGVLHEVPFEILGRAQGPSNFKNFPYLLRRYAVSYASSGSLWWKQCAAARIVPAPGLQSFIGFAPRYAEKDTLSALASRTRTLEVLGGGYPDLPESRKEVQEIAGLLQGTAYLGAEASERQFKQSAPHCRILHLAMHTWIENRDPRFSKLFFTHDPQEKEEDNDLNALELYNLRLPAQMVVLSACETGIGRLQRGEGVMSLARAFAYAGVPATLMSLWSVEDGATRSLMVDFYRQLKTGVEKDAALRRAKMDYLRNCPPERASPYYWAGFIASGSMAPLFGR